MNKDALPNVPVPELLAMTQTNITPDASEGFAIAKMAYDQAETPVQKGTAARQAGFRAEQAGETPAVMQEWFDNSRSALSSDDPRLKRELIATELLTGRATALRIQRVGSKALELVKVADDAFQRGEAILAEQHTKAQRWDRFGTMLARHRATHEAMNGTRRFGAANAVRGIWRALRAEREGAPEEHRAFVVKQLGLNAVAATLAISKPLHRFSKAAAKRHDIALKLLG